MRNKKINDKVSTIVKEINDFTFGLNTEQIEELEQLLLNDRKSILKNYAYAINVVATIRAIASGELGIVYIDRLKVIKLIIDKLAEKDNKESN